MHRLEQVDQQLSSALKPIADIAASVEMPLICLLSDEAEIAKHTYPGIYRIDVQTGGASNNLAAWVEGFQAEWEHADYKKSFTPNFKKKRIAGHTTLSEWMPLYLGKSKNVARRVLEHINLPLGKTTFALKLKARPAMSSRVLRLHALEVKVKNYDVIVPALETALRNRFHPLIGKQ
ncbi:hypothetical protein [Ideonella sp. BN130291]|uniref:hypothetical protein n=1 Tax=Ideonella sp. BN130291 TaxID=3112940 RepID=UPI002E27302A|nr:hypothetical protein [Ideonella sp. BN130291]